MAAIDNPSLIEGSVKPSSIEVESLEPNLSAVRITQIESNQQGMWDYQSGSVAIYAGFAPMGLAVGSNGWLLQKYTYDGNNNVTARQIAYGNWTNRASYTYS